MLTALLLFALTTSSGKGERICPPAGFEHVRYATGDEEAELVEEAQHQLSQYEQHHGGRHWSGPAGMEGRPVKVDLDLYVRPNGESAAVCIVAGERKVSAAVAEGLADMKLTTTGAVILRLNVKFVWRSEHNVGGLSEFSGYELKVTPSQRQ